MNTTRREFIKSAVVSGAALSVGAMTPLTARAEDKPKPAGKKMKTLFLGGTGFLGPHTVRAALARGHEMTLFNRGKTHPELFPNVEKLVGDRYSDLEALKGRKWDAVIDTFAYVPKVVEDSAGLLNDAVKQYVLISSISVYPSYKVVGMDETADVATISDEEIAKAKTHRDITGANYGALKALCEQTAEKIMPGRVTNIRPGLIVGPGDPSDRFTYWPVRVDRGGEVLAPGSGKDYIQFIDVRDLGAWIVMCIENGVFGVFNADSPQATNTVASMLATCKQVSQSDAKFTWVPADFLAEQKVQPWSDMPVWAPPEGEDIGFGQVSVAKAMKAGLKHREVKETVADTLKWFKSEPQERQANLRAGIKPEREKEVLAAWHEKQGD